MDVTVDEKLIASIKIINGPAKTSYIEGNNFDPSGMVVHTVYNNGSEETITGYQIGSTKLGLGQTGISLSYNGKNCTLPISVRAKSLINLAVTKAPTKTGYIVGQSFDPAGMIVTATYDNGDTVVISGYTIDKTMLATTDKAVTVTYNSKTCTTPITVNEKSLQSIVVTKAPTKTTYIEGNDFDPTGMVVTTTYDNGDTATISGYAINKTVLATTDKAVTVNYGGKTCTIPITVNAKSLQSITVTTVPTKIIYIEGDSFDPTGMVVTATYDNGDTAAISGYTVDKTILTSTDNVITITYGNKICKTPITVNTKSSNDTNPMTSAQVAAVHLVFDAITGTIKTGSTKPAGDLNIPSSVDGVKVVSVGANAFNSCSSLTSVTIPSGVTSIGSRAFYYCSGLTAITISSGVTSIGTYAFQGCSGLKSITIPTSVTSIGDNAFYNCLHIYYYGTATGSPWGAKAKN